MKKNKMQMISYKIYGNHRQYGWELLNTVYLEEKAHEFISYVSAEDYGSVLIVRHDDALKIDDPIWFDYLDLPMRRVRK